MKILVLDIETAPNLAWVWGVWNENIPIARIEEAGEMLCFAAKWVGQTKVTYKSIFHDGQVPMVTALHDLLDKADAVITYNGKKFDIPWANSEFLLLGLAPPAPYKQIDLYPAVKKRFKFPSYKLDYVCKALGIGEKVQHEGFELWKRCIAEEASAWRTMRLYNINDVVITELLYEYILPWIPNLPSFAAYTQEHVCPACGSENLKREGFAYTAQSKYQRYVCRDCGKWSRDTKGEHVSIREVAY